MDLGKFCFSLAVKDIVASKAFYQKLGFEAVRGCGSIDDKWLILDNGQTMIGLFQDMFDENILTFNPADVRAIQSSLKEQNVAIEKEAIGDTGPAHMMLRDPDGNLIMLDQY